MASFSKIHRLANVQSEIDVEYIKAPELGQERAAIIKFALWENSFLGPWTHPKTLDIITCLMPHS